jgi:hypothetical protein
LFAGSGTRRYCPDQVPDPELQIKPDQKSSNKFAITVDSYGTGMTLKIQQSYIFFDNAGIL